MSAQPAPQQLFTIEEYLEREEKAAYKSEYYKGEIFPMVDINRAYDGNGEALVMAGGSMRHSNIGGNIYHALRKRLAGTSCRPFNSDMQIHIPVEQLFTYPDISVICGKRDLFQDKALMNPRVIIEVLSDSTEGYDRGAKFRFYTKIASLQEYVLVSQNERIVEVFRRNEQQRWELFVFAENENVELASVECTLTMDEIYEDTE